MTRLLTAAVAGLVAVMLAACGSSGDDDKADTAAGKAATEQVEVGVLLTGPKGGGVFDVAGGRALDEIAERDGVDVTYSESVDLAKQLQAFSDLAESGSDIVFGHSDAFRDGAIAAAKKYPDTWFVSTGTGSDPQEELPPNFISVEIAENEVGYLSGYAAGLLTESDKVGWVGSLPLIGIGQASEGHKVGVADANPDAKVSTVFVGSFIEPAKGKEAAVGLLDQGNDVLTHNADLSGLGVIEAAAAGGKPAIGHSVDQSERAPDAVVTSVELDFLEAYGPIVAALQDGGIEGGPRRAGVAEGVVKLAPIENVPAKVAEQIERRVAEIADGKFTVPAVEFKPDDAS